MNVTRNILAALALGALAACNTMPGQTPAATLAKATNAYNAAAQVVVAYKGLAPCGSPLATQLCSDPTVVLKLKAGDQVAYDALVAAEKAVKSGASNAQIALDIAMAAANSLAGQTADLKVKP